MVQTSEGIKRFSSKFLRVFKISLATIGAVFLIVTFTPVTIWWTRGLSGPLSDPSGDVLVVLAGSSVGNGIMGYNSYLRAEYALRAYEGGRFRQIIVSGGGEPPISLAIRDFLVSHGVPPERIQVETNSTSTRENAVYCRHYLAGESGTIVLLSSDYHMFRALRTFRKVGLEIKARPIPDSLKRASTFEGRWPAFLTLVTESSKIGYYFLHGWI